jgi:uncharacterized membrane protein YbhN (UPF0104 family)
MATASDPPSFGGTVAGSFLLLYGQLLLPFPSGIGAVDAGLLAGAQHSGGALSLLLLWRLYTSAVGLVLGLAALPLVLRPADERRDQTTSTPCSRAPATTACT